MKIEVYGSSSVAAIVGNALRCPFCHKEGILQPLDTFPDAVIGGSPNAVVGCRSCPNASCRALVFVIIQGDKIVVSYPHERLNFDASGIPPPIVKALEEAITCHASGCYVAAAIMVRKTLEELCEDRNATGKSLSERIRGLEGKVILPKELLDSLDDLRLLGNDAAHIESKEYNEVGEEEVEVAVDLAREVLKAVYQYSAMLAKIKSLKKQS